MLDLLRSVIPVHKFDLTAKLMNTYDPYYINDLMKADKPSSAYESIIEACSNALSTHLYIQHLLNTRQIDEFGDCWNVSSICAEYLAHVGKPAHLFSFTDDMCVFHVEVAELVGDAEYRPMDVDPYNDLPAGNFQFSDWPPMSFNFWQFVWCVRMKSKGYNLKHFKFYNHGAVIDGMHVRQLIHDEIYPNFFMPVRLLSLKSVKEYLTAGRYSRTYS